MMKLYQATSKDVHTVTNLALQLWPDNDSPTLSEEFRELLLQPDCAVFLAEMEGKPAGFAQCQLRHDYVEGTETSPVGYLEGIFVSPEWRKNGLARMLLSACESWAKSRSCQEFASDCELENLTSLQFHLAVGFEEANRIICFRKAL